MKSGNSHSVEFKSQLMDVKEAMAYCNVRSKSSWYEWIKSYGVVARSRVGGVRYHRHDLDGAINAPNASRARKLEATARRRSNINRASRKRTVEAGNKGRAA